MTHSPTAETVSDVPSMAHGPLEVCGNYELIAAEELA